MSKMFGVLPFEILKQDKDEVIMIINYMSEKGASSAREHAANITNEKESDKSFWSAL